MARILYGLCSVGIGHAVRSKEVLDHLLKKNDVLILASSKAYEYLNKFFPSKVIDIEGFELAFKDNSVENFETLILNLKKVNSENYGKVKKLFSKIDEFKPQIVISDWEPLSSVYAHSRKLPLISIDNQHYLIFGEFDVPKKYWFQYFKARAVLQSLMRKSDYYVITLLPGCKLKKKEHIYGVPAIIRKSIMKQEAGNGDYILVYQSTKSYEGLFDILKEVNQKFIIYGFDKNKKSGNLIFKKFNSGRGFIKDLAGAKAVIANGGFTLISEAIYLGKPLLVVPIKKHFEQILNALYVSNHKYGEFYEDLDEKSVSHFIVNMDDYKVPRKNVKGNIEILKLLDKIIKREVKE